jgi:hypothetical protein
MRENKLQLSVAAKKLKRNPRSVLKHAGAALKRRKQDYLVKPSDEIPRSMKIVSAGEEIVVVVDSETATMIGKYHNARKKFLNEGDDAALVEFEGVTITDIDGNEFVLDIDIRNLQAIEEAVGGYQIVC